MKVIFLYTQKESAYGTKEVRELQVDKHCFQQCYSHSDRDLEIFRNISKL
jgi:hypothetical protein